LKKFLIIGDKWNAEVDSMFRSEGYIGEEIIALEVY